MNFLVINGPNLNMLGIREPDKYGNETLEDITKKISEHCKKYNAECCFFQSNHEGDLVDYIQKAYYENADGIIINPGAYTHTSVALLDALNAVKIPAAEVHITDVQSREDFRKISYIREACIASVSGKGTDGYLIAADKLYCYITETKNKI